MDFNRIKDLLISLAKANGLTLADLQERDPKTGLLAWSIDWNDDLSESFKNDIESLQAALDLYEAALAKNDMLAAQAGLINARISAHQLMNFFDSLREDLKKAYLDSRFKWPEFPEGYKVPEHYGYKSG